MRREGGIDLAPELIVDQLLEHVITEAKRSTTWQPGARELLAELKELGVPCALVTMSYRNLASVIVGQLPPGTFSAIITGDEVTHGKPHPEPYLTAAAAIGADAPSCIAIEDSPTGLTAALQAGCVTIAVPHTAPITPQAGLTIVDSLTALGGAAGLSDLMAAASR